MFDSMGKYIYTLLLVFTISCLPASAQVGENRNDLSVGISSGYILNKVDFTPKIKQNYKGSPYVGIAARYICEKYFASICAIQVELNYANLGWEELIEDGSGNTYSRDLKYIQLPLLMQMGWGRETRGLKFFINAGPQIGYYIGGDEKRGGDWNTSMRPNGVTYQYGREIDNKLEYGIAGGLGLELSTKIGHFILEGRYYYGLSDIYDNSKKGFFGRSANQSIVIRGAYLLDLIKTKE